MAATRSPNYPQLSLQAALSGVRKVWKEETWSKVSQEAIASHLGFKSLNGSAQVAISALRKYGLLEGRGKSLSVSKRAVTLLEGHSESAEYQKAIEEAAKGPSLFAELYREFEATGSLPTAKNLRFQLIQRGFNADAAGKAAKSYLETMGLVTGSSNGYTKPDGGDDPQENSEGNDSQDRGDVRRSPHVRPVRRTEERRRMTPPSAPGIREDVFSMDEGDAVLHWPGQLSQASFADFRDWLGLIERKAERAVGVATSEQEASEGT